MGDPSTIILAFDIGEKRVGVAICNALTLLPQPLKTIEVHQNILDEIEDLVRMHKASIVVVGIPRGLKGQTTYQTTYIEELSKRLKEKISQIRVYLQDEALTSVQAESELLNKHKGFKKSDIDAIAAVYILEDFIHENSKVLSRG